MNMHSLIIASKQVLTLMGLKKSILKGDGLFAIIESFIHSFVFKYVFSVSGQSEKLCYLAKENQGRELEQYVLNCEL